MSKKTVTYWFVVDEENNAYTDKAVLEEIAGQLSEAFKEKVAEKIENPYKSEVSKSSVEVKLYWYLESRISVSYNSDHHHPDLRISALEIIKPILNEYEGFRAEQVRDFKTIRVNVPSPSTTCP